MKYQYWLSNISGVGNRTIEKLRLTCNSAEEIYFLKEEQLEKIPGITAKDVNNIRLGKQNWKVDEEFEKLCGLGISFYSQEMEAFPKCLKMIQNAPYSIYVKGKLPSEQKRKVAIVGARMCSAYGASIAKELGKKLAQCGVQTISGMARGIDSYGHLGTLEADGETFAVLGCGVNICYPESGREIYQKIINKGGLISEYPPYTQPAPKLFPARNRIISAFSDTVVVVEAREKSGSLITADFALEQGKDIYAVPGRIDDALSGGCNNLIRQGAYILSKTEEFLKELELCRINKEFQENFNKLLLEKDESLVYACVDLRPRSIQELVNRTGYEIPVLTDILQRLVQKDFITENFKNYYIRKI